MYESLCVLAWLFTLITLGVSALRAVRDRTEVRLARLREASARGSSELWQRTSTERLAIIQRLQQEKLDVQVALRAKEGSVVEQQAQILAKDTRLVHLAGRAEMAEARLQTVMDKWRESAKECDDLREEKAGVYRHCCQAEAEKARAVGLAREAVERLSEQTDVAEEAAAARDRLQALVAAHRDKRGHECCHLNDNELYAGAGLESADPQLPPLDEFLPECIRYWHEKQGLPFQPAPGPDESRCPKVMMYCPTAAGARDQTEESSEHAP